MRDLAKKSLLFGIGALFFTKEKSENLVKELVQKGKLSQGDVKALSNDILKKGQEEKAILQELLQDEIKKTQENLGLVTREDLNLLEQRLQRLEHKIDQLTN